MIEQQNRDTDPAREARQRRVGGVAFAAGVLAGLAFFAFFPGLPHIIDWGAVLVSLGVGLLARWGARGWVGRG
ncbi:hypothetical protein AB0O01_07300 [Streptomyces sp. NPDC093252]|uniref:hypothetical protein n=1 Tax=Streptomyces sp. NPDC093252 TaxID=3154980 RepID=UPI00341E668D